MEKNSIENEFWKREHANKGYLLWILIGAACLILIGALAFLSQNLWLDPGEEEIIFAENENPSADNNVLVGENDLSQNETTEDDENVPSNTEENEEETSVSNNEIESASAADTAPIVWLPPSLGMPNRNFGHSFDVTFGDFRFHNGIDIPLEEGSPIFAVAAGEISAFGDDERWGGRVEITHSGGYKSVYLGVKPASLSIGQKIEGGETIASVGTAPPEEKKAESHLHFELWQNDEKVDPSSLINFQ